MGVASTVREKSPYDPEKRPIEDHPIHAYGLALRALEATGIPHLVGGGLSLVQYGGLRDKTSASSRRRSYWVRRAPVRPSVKWMSPTAAIRTRAQSERF